MTKLDDLAARAYDIKSALTDVQGEWDVLNDEEAAVHKSMESLVGQLADLHTPPLHFAEKGTLAYFVNIPGLNARVCVTPEEAIRLVGGSLYVGDGRTVTGQAAIDAASTMTQTDGAVAGKGTGVSIRVVELK